MISPANDAREGRLAERQRGQRRGRVAEPRARRAERGSAATSSSLRSSAVTLQPWVAKASAARPLPAATSKSSPRAGSRSNDANRLPQARFARLEDPLREDGLVEVDKTLAIGTGHPGQRISRDRPGTARDRGRPPRARGRGRRDDRHRQLQRARHPRPVPRGLRAADPLQRRDNRDRQRLGRRLLGRGRRASRACSSCATRKTSASGVPATRARRSRTDAICCS